MHWYFYPILVGTGILVGFINTLAGSGSLITLPLLMFIGLPANVANGTNRVAILMQTAVGVRGFKKHKVFQIREGIWLSLPAVIGALIGAALAVDIDDRTMTRAIGLLLIVMFFLIILKPEAWVKGKAGQVKAKPGLLQVLIFFGIGLYGGFIQAGVGFFLLGGLVLGAGYDLIKANAIKNLVVLLYTPFALAVFVWNGQVNWLAGLTLGVGNMLGAWIATRVAVSWGTKFVRIVLLTVIFLASLKLLGVFNLF
ncbi:MAG: sulfite exporter TauE/SafE family protein [Bacteroidales bacterium]|nr:sulfite exporter TauE/SafE family protein [Bacteroidales bacterium]